MRWCRKIQQFLLVRKGTMYRPTCLFCPCGQRRDDRPNGKLSAETLAVKNMAMPSRFFYACASPQRSLKKFRGKLTNFEDSCCASSCFGTKGASCCVYVYECMHVPERNSYDLHPQLILVPICGEKKCTDGFRYLFQRTGSPSHL